MKCENKKVFIAEATALGKPTTTWGSRPHTAGQFSGTGRYGFLPAMYAFHATCLPKAAHYMVAAAKRHGITLRAVDCGPDHCHVFTAACKNHSPSHVAMLLKGFSSYLMRKNHWELFADDLYGGKFWSGGYFYRTVGAVNAETVQRYVAESQSKHWIEASGQRKLIESGA